MSGTTETDILSTIPDLDSGTDTGTETSTDTSPGTSSAQPTQTGGQQTSAQPTQTTEGQQPAQPTPVRRRDGLVETPNPDDPKTRDLVDPVSGRIVAKGGIERRVFEEGQRHARENNQLKTELGNAKRMLSSINEVTQEAVRLNIAPQDQVVAIRIMAQYLQDPVKTLQELVQEVKSKGYKIDFLEQGVTPGMDMAAIARMIDNKMAPIAQQRQQQMQEAQQRQQAEQNLNSFLEEVPEANVNLDVLAEMLQSQPALTLYSAHIRMVRWAQENGLDWTQSLKQQIAVARSQQPTNQPEPQPTTPRRPLPGNRSATARSTQPVNGSATQHNENASWSDIIRASMQEHGVQF